MKKFLAVVKHEYKKVVLKWSFLIGTLLLPILAACFAVVPAIIFSLKGEPTRMVVVDPTGKIAPRLMENLAPAKIAEKTQKAMRESITDMNASQEEKMRQNAQVFASGFRLVEFHAAGKTAEDIRRDLAAKISAGEINAYLLIPENYAAENASYEFRSRKGGDIVENRSLREGLNDAVRSQRLADAGIGSEQQRELGRTVKLDEKGLDEKGEEKNSEATWAAAFVIGLMIYITLAIYGQVIMGAVVEEKETRIAEILFSSARPFELMMGKLVGVGLAGLTQLSIWVISAAALLSFVALQADFSQFATSIPAITPLMVVYFLVFFLLGFFVYASIFALIGSMVTTVQEGGQFAFPPIMILLVGFYFSFAVIRDPNSDVSFWVSIAPFFAPITMPVRILAETPPFWQIALSIGVNVVAIAGLVWLASRVYRVGMLMYGKRATIPEVWKWIRQP
ncbi:MAG: ABC transporter permease [Pyrinomonadaceae bacterium]